MLYFEVCKIKSNDSEFVSVGLKGLLILGIHYKRTDRHRISYIVNWVCCAIPYSIPPLQGAEGPAKASECPLTDSPAKPIHWPKRAHASGSCGSDLSNKSRYCRHPIDFAARLLSIMSFLFSENDQKPNTRRVQRVQYTTSQTKVAMCKVRQISPETLQAWT